MKKVMLLLSAMVLAFSAAYALTPEEVMGKWESNTVKYEPTPMMPMATSVKMIYTFGADGQFDGIDDGSMTFELGNGAAADIFFKEISKGTYKVEGDSIMITTDPKLSDITFTEDDVRIRGIEDGAMAAQMQTELFNQFKMSMDMMKEQGEETTAVLNSVMITGQKMVCTVDDKYINFKRKKK